VPVLINSIDVRRVLRLVEDNALATLTDYLVAEIEVLARGGAALGLLAANTPHIVFDDVRRRSPPGSRAKKPRQAGQRLRSTAARS